MAKRKSKRQKSKPAAKPDSTETQSTVATETPANPQE